MKVQIMGHNYGTHRGHSLQKGIFGAIFAPWNGQTFEKMSKMAYEQVEEK